MNLQDPVGSYRILENPVGSCIGFLPGLLQRAFACSSRMTFSKQKGPLVYNRYLRLHRAYIFYDEFISQFKIPRQISADIPEFLS